MLALAASAILAPTIQIDYEEFAGLQIRANGIPLVAGSSFQYYEDNWKKGIYSSNWRPKTITKGANGNVQVRFINDDGKVSGTLNFERTPTGVKASCAFRWGGDYPVRLEHTVGQLWAPALEKGTIRIDGVSGFSPAQFIAPGKSPEERRFGPDGSRFDFDSPFASISATLNPGGATLFDARGYKQDWAENREVFWLGHLNQRIMPNSTLRYQIEWKIDPRPRSQQMKPLVTTSLDGQSLRDALSPNRTELPILPRPKQIETSSARIRLSSRFRFEIQERHQHLADEFERTLWRRWQKNGFTEATTTPTIRAQVNNIGLPAEGYRIRAAGNELTLTGQDEAGLRHAFRTVVWLVKAENGRLVIPEGEISDWPSLAWRGLHMFVGPEALSFQTRMMDQVFAPLKLNRVVLQCERTNWLTLPGIETPNTMKREDLRELFARYRVRGFEPIPLIQSLGHCYWIFANGQNLDIAINRDIPYTLDPRRDRTRQVLRSLWSEAKELLQPKTIHFGMDEIDMRGMPEDPNFSTRLWVLHMPWLQDLAKEMQVTPMIWGDMLLHPSEASDAANAPTLEIARQRRAAVRPTTMIADWHYKDDPNPDVYKSLALWKSRGHSTLASSWFRPDNIRGFSQAAIRTASTGLLQTTWAGYESNERNMVQAFDQFAAYVQAADASWSGRSDTPYNPSEVLRRLYFAEPEPALPQRGASLVLSESAPGPEFRIGSARFKPTGLLDFHSALDGVAAAAPTTRVFRVSHLARQLMIAADCLHWLRDNETLAQVTVKLADGRLVTSNIAYGQHVRAPRDQRPTLLAARDQGRSAILIPFGESERVTEIRIEQTHPAGGLRVHGLTLISPGDKTP